MVGRSGGRPFTSSQRRRDRGRGPLGREGPSGVQRRAETPIGYHAGEDDDDLKEEVRDALKEDEDFRDEVRDDVREELREDEDLKEEVRDELRDDDELRDEVKEELGEEEKDRGILAARLVAGWMQSSVLPAYSARYDRYQCVALDLEDDPTAAFIASMMHGTRRSHRGLLPSQGGTGIHWRSPPEFEIVSIERIVNPRLQADYLSFRDNIRGKHSNVPVDRLVTAPSDEDNAFSKGHQRVDGTQWNERFLFHGAPYSSIEKICRAGLDHRRGGTNAGRLFGVGTYLAEDSSKSDIYAGGNPDDDDERRCCMLVCRACLGETSYLSHSAPNLSMPPNDADSVTALRSDETGCLDHREYVVYERAQAVPEYRIFYAHAAGCECSRCVL